MWTDHARRVASSSTRARRQRFVGEHDGYERLADPVIHRREISSIPIDS